MVDLRDGGIDGSPWARSSPGATLMPFRWLGGAFGALRTPPNENLRVAPSRAGRHRNAKGHSIHFSQATATSFCLASTSLEKVTGVHPYFRRSTKNRKLRFIREMRERGTDPGPRSIPCPRSEICGPFPSVRQANPSVIARSESASDAAICGWAQINRSVIIYIEKTRDKW